MWRVVVALASPLLPLSSGCFDPVFIGREVPEENHVPLVEVSPQPGFAPDAVNVGDGCQPDEFLIRRLEDLDVGDDITVRYDLVVSRAQLPVRVNLSESAPIEATGDGTYPLTDRTSVTLSRAFLTQKLGADLREQADPAADLYQLLELRISDGGFILDANENPIAPDGRGLVYFSWQIDLIDEACEVTP